MPISVNPSVAGVFASPRIISEKTTINDGAITIADQVIGSLFIPAGTLKTNDCFRVLATLGRDNGTDGYGTLTSIRMGTLGTTADSGTGAINLSSGFTPGGTQFSQGLERWFRVVSVGTNSQIELLGTGNVGSSWASILSGGGVGVQSTLTGYNLATQDGFLTITTTMATATTTRPRTGYMRLEIV